MNKIQNVLNNLNVKIMRFNEQKKKVEEEAGQGRHSTSSLISENTFSELSEMVSI